MRNAMRFAGALAFLTAAAVGSADVTFELAADRLTSPAASVALVGSFNDWNASATPMASANGKWSASVALADGRHQYRFVWTDAGGATHLANDPGNPYLTDDGKKSVNNVLEIAGGKRVQPTGEWERFAWEDPDAKWVSVTGDFNEWDMRQYQLVPRGKGTWVAFLPLKPPFEYKFLIGGLWKLDPDAPRVPNGLGGSNSYRPAASIVEPETVTIERAIAPGDESELERIQSWADARNYGQAVALARKVAEVNVAAFGTTAPVALKALDLEGAIHRRWNRWEEAARCWKRLADSGATTDAAIHGINELAAYYIYVVRDSENGRILIERAIVLAPDNADLLIAIHHWLALLQRERRTKAVIAVVDDLLSRLPAPTPDDPRYAGWLAEFWMIKAGSHNRLRQTDEARAAFQKVVEVSPNPEDQNAQRARVWLERLAKTPRPTP